MRPSLSRLRIRRAGTIMHHDLKHPVNLWTRLLLCVPLDLTQQRSATPQPETKQLECPRLIICESWRLTWEQYTLCEEHKTLSVNSWVHIAGDSGPVEQRSDHNNTEHTTRVCVCVCVCAHFDAVCDAAVRARRLIHQSDCAVEVREKAWFRCAFGLTKYPCFWRRQVFSARFTNTHSSCCYEDMWSPQCPHFFRTFKAVQWILSDRLAIHSKDRSVSGSKQLISFYLYDLWLSAQNCRLIFALISFLLKQMSDMIYRK